MRVYLSARMSRQEEMQDVRQVLAPLVTVVARWLDEPYIPVKKFEAVAHEIAFRDIRDIDGCDTLIRFSDVFDRKSMVPSNWITGGRMWETGYAYAKGKRIIVLGGHQTVFDWLPSIEHVKDVIELCLRLKKSAVGESAELQHARQLCQMGPWNEKSSR